MFRALLSLTLLSFISFLSSEEVKEVIPRLEKFIVEGMELTHVPGVAVAIVQDDKVVYLKGFGFSNVEKKSKVTEQTVFQLASVSKPFTSTILASLVSKGKIKWDSKISDLNPDFRLSDPWVTAHLTIKDLLSHRSGLPDHAGDILEDLGYDQDLILHQLRFIKPLEAFREHYAYTNFGYSEAAFATSAFLKTSWHDLAKNTLYDPLGMSATSSLFKDYNENPEKATTYVINEGRATALSPPREPDAQSPAGGASSSVSDIGKWMILQLGGFQDKDIVDEKVLLETHTPVITTGVDKKSGLPSFYAMGWDVSFDESGNRFLKHSGAFSLGVRTQVVLLPEKKTGIAILTNASPTALPEAVSKAFYDLLLKGDVEKGLVQKYNELWMKFQVDPQVEFKVDLASSTPALPLEKYEGKFYNDYYGLVEIKKGLNGLEFIIGPKSKTFILRHLNRDVFSFKTEGENSIGETQVIFSFDEEEKPRTLAVDYLNKFGMGVFTPHDTD